MNDMMGTKITSMEVAQMVDKEHSKLLRDIRNYVSQLGESKIALSDFFTESTYVTEQNKVVPCYLVTKKDCEFIAHKLTGQKGTEFTAWYISRFHEMVAKKCKEVHRLISSIRHWMLRLIIAKLNQILVGYYHYYGITDNFRAIGSFRYRVERSLFYWLNWRSQKVNYTWKAFNDMLKVYPLARPQIYVSIYET